MTFEEIIERTKNNPTVLITGGSAICIYIVAIVLREYYLYAPAFGLTALEWFVALRDD